MAVENRIDRQVECTPLNLGGRESSPDGSLSYAPVRTRWLTVGEILLADMG